MCLVLLATLLVVTAESRAQTATSSCYAPALVTASKLTLVGELHGNEETLDWLGSVACAISSSGEVIVALEISRAEQERVETFMHSAGTRSDQDALVAGPFWRGQDGRASEAVVALLERLRSLAAVGSRISVATIDDWKNPAGRDAAMAAALRELHATRPEARIVALMGNRHARSDRRELAKDADDHPVGYLLRDLNPLSVLVEYSGGATWACAPQCGPLVLHAPRSGPREAGSFSAEPPRPGYHASVSVGHGTVSPPVSQRGP